MGKWLDITLDTDKNEGLADHIPDEDLGRLAEGRTEPEDREKIIRHLNRCAECRRVLDETLAERATTDRRRFLAAAASLLLVIGGGGLLYRYFGMSGGVITAELVLDRELKSLLSGAETLVWTGKRAARLAALLKERGVAVAALDKVVLTEPYFRPPTRNLFAPPEVLTVQIKDGTALLTVQKKEEDGRR
jgi:anti-sigma factor RsiW